MTQEELNQIKEILKAHLTANNARIESQFDLIDLKLDSINEHLSRQNGRLGKAELAISEFVTKIAVDDTEKKNRLSTCPQSNRITKIETELITKKEIKKYIVGGIGVIGILLTIFVTIINLI